jgi:hypothetical protein
MKTEHCWKRLSLPALTAGNLFFERRWMVPPPLQHATEVAGLQVDDAVPPQHHDKRLVTKSVT